jgi:error-prone DNA polymerase
MLPAYAELHCLTNFSFLRGASHPEELVERAKASGYSALAITDECSFSGLVRAHVAAKSAALPLVIGTEVTLADGVKLVLLATDRRSYGNLSQLITRGRRSALKGSYALGRDDVAAFAEGLLALWVPADPPRRWESSDEATALGATALRTAQCSLLGRRHVSRPRLDRRRALREPSDRVKLAYCAALAQATGLPQVAAGDVHMHVRARRALQDTMTAIRLKKSDRRMRLRAASERRTASALARPARDDLSEALLVETFAIVERCRFSLDELRYEYPDEIVPPGHTPASYLRELTERGLARRYGEGRCPPDVRELIEHELALIAELRYEPYFLTVHDIVAFARSRDILCQGRGSAANSAVCYALGITEVDPARMSMLFERFLSKERNEPPDIDVDFEHQRREEVMQYVYAKYGRDRAALAATLITYRPKSAVRDVGRALGLELAQVDRLSGILAWWDGREVKPERIREAGFEPDNPVLVRLLALTGRADGISTASVAARRRLRHRPRSRRAHGAGGERRDGRSHRPPVGQGRSRRAGAAQGRLSGARHAVGDPARAGDGVALSRPRAPDAGHPGRGSPGLRDVPARRHDRRVPDRIARAAVDAAAAQGPHASTTS